MKIEVKRKKVFWYYIIKAKNGQTIVTSETYYSRSNALRAANKAALALKLNVISK